MIRMLDICVTAPESPASVATDISYDRIGTTAATAKESRGA